MINISSLCKNKNNKLILDNINLSVTKGEFIVIYGNSGSGKSTLLHLIGGLEKADSGSIVINNKKVQTMNRKETRNLRKNTLGYVFQNYALIDNMTVEKNLNLVSLDKKKIKSSLNEVSLSQDILNQKVLTLSGGEQQRVAIARVLLQDVDIVLADEPTGNLDNYNSQGIFVLLQKLQNNGKTIICVSHNDRIKEYASQVYYLKDKKLMEEE